MVIKKKNINGDDAVGLFILWQLGNFDIKRKRRVWKIS